MNALTIEDIAILRKAAANTVNDYPHRPLMLELALVGLSRMAMSSLNVTALEQNAITWVNGEKVQYPYAVAWHVKNNVLRKTRLSESQWNIVIDYMKWRRNEIYVDSAALFVVKNKEGFWERMKPERVRAEFHRLGNSCYVARNLEIPDLHRSMSNILRFQGVPESLIYSIYGKKRYAPQPEEPDQS